MRRWREGDLTAAQRDRVLSVLGEDLQRMDVVEILPEVTRRTHALLVRHRLRAGDALQLSACPYLRERTGGSVAFVAFDERLATAAAAAGLPLAP